VILKQNTRRLIDRSLWFPAVGAAYGTSKAGIGIAGLGQFKPELIMKVPHLPHLLSTRCPSHNGCCAQSLIPVVMSGIIAVYGLVVSVLIVGRRKWRHIASFIQTSSSIFFWDPSRSVTRLSALFWFCASGSRSCVWSHWFGCGICNWHRWGFSTSPDKPFFFPVVLNGSCSASEHMFEKQRYL